MSEGPTTKGKAFDRRLFARVMTFVHPYRGLFWSSFALTIVLAVIGVVRPALLGNMIDGPAKTGDRHGLIVLLWIVIGLLFLEGIVQFVQAYWTARLGLNVTFDLRQKLYERVINFKLRYFDRTPIGTLVTRVVSDIETVGTSSPKAC
jgi:ATP-binding cassette subfamily B multidrug efflux pump